jgi:dihydroxy-acid dehydratase
MRSRTRRDGAISAAVGIERTMSASGRGASQRLTSYGDEGFSRFLRGAFLAAAGYDAEDLSRPMIGIAHTCSDYTPCHRQMPELVEAVRRGVLEAGGLPMVFPTMSLGETLLSPTSMLFRNLAAMETEELIRAQPMDGVVLLGGCDKTVPAQLMAALSADLPALLVVAGPMTTGSWRGERLGACTDCRLQWARYRAGELSDAEIAEAQGELCPTAGTCMVMGTASTMACLVEALGLMLPGGATPPATSGARLRHAAASGRRVVEIAAEGMSPSAFVSPASFHNALAVLAAIGGSTNAVVHLLAAAGRAGVELGLDDVDRVAREMPLLVDCKPTGSGYLEDFDRAGGVPVLLASLAPLLELGARRVDGRTLADRVAATATPRPWQRTIGTLEHPVGPPGSLAVLRGSLAPAGAVIKSAAASRELLHHRGPAVVFESPADVARRIDDPSLGITPGHVLVLRNAGPVAAAMPEAGSFPIPRYLAASGTRDMVRISDARMSGTSYGTVVLHCSPEAAVGGPLAFVRDGDLVELDVGRRAVELHVDAAELARRKHGWHPPRPPERGWRRLYAEHVLGAEAGADLDFLA